MTGVATRPGHVSIDITEVEARTMALDASTHKIYLPCEQVKPGQVPLADPENLPEFAPGTFHLLVVEPRS